MADTFGFSKLVFNGMEYEVGVTTNVMADFQDKFNRGFFEVTKMLTDDKLVFKLVRWLLWELINESIKRSNKRNSERTPLFEEWEIGDMLTFNEMVKMIKHLNDVIEGSLSVEGEEAEGNETP